MLRIIPVINNKGGVGKTTTSVNLAAGIARAGHRVLLVDLDSQGSASMAVGVPRSELDPGVAAALFDGVPLTNLIRSTSEPHLDLLTGSTELASADMRLGALPTRVTHLARVLSTAREDYDYLILDCAPATSLLNINVLVAADAIVIPCAPSYLSVAGLIGFGEVIREVRTHVGAPAPILGIVLTMADVARDDVRSTMEALRRQYGGKLFDTAIRPDSALEIAPVHGQSIFQHAPESSGAADYRRLTQEILERARAYNALYARSGRKHDVVFDEVAENVLTNAT